MQGTRENGGREMKVRTAGQVQGIGIASLAFTLAFFACGGAMASDVERQIPAILDAAGSGLTVNNPTVQRIEGRAVKMTARLAAKEISPGATAADSPSRTGLTGTPREGSGGPEATLSAPPPAPGEITVRSMVGFLKGLRASRKEKPATAVAAPVPELRLGRTDTSPPEIN